MNKTGANGVKKVYDLTYFTIGMVTLLAVILFSIYGKKVSLSFLSY